MRDIDGDYRRALLDEYTGYVRAGRTDDAEQVAQVLREQYGHEVPSGEPAAPERADVPKLPEAAVEPKPQHAERPEPSAKDVRAWAAEQGIDVPARGKLPAELVEQYLAAQG